MIDGSADEAAIATPPRGVHTVSATAPPPAHTPAAPTAPDLSFLKRPAISAGAAYLTVLAVAFVASLFLNGLVQDALSDSIGSADTGGLGGRLPFLLVGMALFGKLSASATASAGLVSGGLSASVFLVPLALTFVALVGAWLATALQPRVTQDARSRWRDSVATGALLGVLAVVVTLMTTWTWTGAASFVGGTITVQVDALGVFFGALAVGTLGSALGAATVPGGMDLSRLGVRVPDSVSHVANTAGIGGGIVAAVLSLVGVIGGIVKVGLAGTIGAMATVGPNLLAWAGTVGGLGSVSATSGTTSDSAPSETVLNLFESGGWSWLLLLVPVLGIGIGSVRGYLAVGRRSWRSAWVTPAVLAVGALLTLALTRVSIDASLGAMTYYETMQAGIGISAVSVLLAAAWGLAHEASERHLAPYVVALWPGLVTLNAKLPWTATSAAVTAATPAPGSAPAGKSVRPSTDTHVAPPVVLPPVAIDRRKVARVAILLGAAVVVVGGIAGTRAILSSTVFSPSKPVEQYVAALEAGRVSEAFALVDPDVPNAERGLLTDAIYEQVEARTSGGKVTSTEVHDSVAYVTVASDQDGAKSSTTYTLRKDGKAWLLFDRWTLERVAVPQVDVSAHLGRLDDGVFTVNGVHFEETPDGYGLFYALPGRYTVSLPDKPLFEHGEVTVLVAGDGSTEIEGDPGASLTYEMTEDTRQAVLERAGQYVDECLAGMTSFASEDCGIELYVSRWVSDDARDITWSVDGTPDIWVDTTSDWTALQATVEGRATVAATLVAHPDAWRDEDEAFESSDWFGYSLTFPVTDGSLGEPTISQ